MNWRSATFALASVAFSPDEADRNPEQIQYLIALRLPPAQIIQLVVAQADMLPFDIGRAQESRPPPRAAIAGAPFALQALVIPFAHRPLDADDPRRDALILAERAAVPFGHRPVGLDRLPRRRQWREAIQRISRVPALEMHHLARVQGQRLATQLVEIASNMPLRMRHDAHVARRERPNFARSAPPALPQQQPVRRCPSAPTCPPSVPSARNG